MVRPEDYLVEIRGRKLDGTGDILARRGAIPTHDLRLKFQPVFNGVGSWTVQLPAEHPMVAYLRKPGSGIIITNIKTGKVEMSGATSKPSKKSTASDPKGTVTIGGLDDNRLAFDALAFPLPGEDDAGQQTVAYDIRTGNGESLLRQYFAYNVANGANALVGAPAAWAPAGRLGGLRDKLRIEAVNANQGPTVTTQRARFDNLGELMNKIATESGGIGWRIVQVGDKLEMQVYTPVDRTPFVRLDIKNGTLTEQSVETAPPEVTRLIMAGQGELEKRQFIPITSTAATTAEDDWGLVIEEFKDQRNTGDVDELTDAGNGILSERGFTKVAVKATPAQNLTMVFMEDFNLGDKVAVVIDGQEQPNSHVTEAAIVVDYDGVQTAVAIGDIADFDSDSALRGTVTDNTRRIDNLERNTSGAIDDGWEDLSSHVVSPLAGSLEGRIIDGRDVEIRGLLTGTVTASTGATAFTSALPAKWRPTTRTGVGSGYSVGYSPAVRIGTDGVMTVANRDALSGLQLTVRYMLG